MKTKTEESRVIVSLPERIDSVNAPEVKKEMEEIRAANPGRTLELDAEHLDYISSAGLRVLLQLVTMQKGALPVYNVSPQVYEIFEMTGFNSLLQAKKRMREFSVEGCEVIGRGAIGTVYRVDADTIVKVYEIPDSLSMIENEQRRAKQAFLKGIPTAISYDVVKVGDKLGSVFELLKASTYNDMIIEAPGKLNEIVDEYTRFVRQVHGVKMERGELPGAKDIFLGYLDQLQGVLDEEPQKKLRELLAAMPEDLHVVHGDIQMKNVMCSNGEPLLIDMDTLSVGDPVFDLLGLYITYQMFQEDEPDNAQKFLGLTADQCDRIWERILHGYFQGEGDETVLSEEEIETIEKKIRSAACVRFLFLVAVLNIGRPELRRIRIDHARAHLQDLLPGVDSLAVRA